MDTNTAHDSNYQPQDGLRRAQGDSELRPNSSRLRSSKPPKSELLLSDEAVSKSAGHWSTIREMARDFGSAFARFAFMRIAAFFIRGARARRAGTARATDSISR